MFENIFQKYLTSKNIIFFIVAILFMIFVCKIPDIAIMFFASFVLACSLEPLVKKLMEKNFKRSTASAIVLAATLFLIFIFFVPLIVLAGHEIFNFADSFPQYMDTIKDYIYDLPFVNKSNLAELDINGVISSATGVTTHVISETINVGKNLGSAFIYLVVSIIIIYYFMADKDTVRNTVLKLFPSNMRKKTNDIIDSISQKIGGYVVAQITTMASVGIIMTLGLCILKVEYALLLGLITCILDIIPVFGPAIALLICLIVSYKAGFGILSLICLVFAIAQIVENNFVRPYVFGKFLDLHPLIIYLFLFLTAKHLGLIGVVFAPAIAATVVVLVEEVYMKNIE